MLFMLIWRWRTKPDVGKSEGGFRECTWGRGGGCVIGEVGQLADLHPLYWMTTSGNCVSE